MCGNGNQWKRIGVLGAALVWGGSAMAEWATIEGTAAYRERMALQPGAVLEVELLDVSLADAPSERLASMRYKVQGQVPVPFELRYDPSLIVSNHTYTVSAKLLQGRNVMFRTDTVHPVLSRGGGDRVDLMLVRASGRPAPRTGVAPPAASSGLIGPTWVAEDIDQRGAMDMLQSSITFTPEGDAQGSGGCNSFRGTYKLDGVGLTLGPLAGTRRACPEAIMDQEARFHDALGRVRSFRIEQGLLYLLDEQGRAVLRLWQRQEAS